RRGWRSWSGPTCLWCRWTRCGAGGATTICSPTCCEPAWRMSGRRGCPSCTAPRLPGMRGTGWPTMPFGMRWPPGKPAGRPGWVARLGERHVEALLGRSEGATLDRWLSALPVAAVRARPRLCLAQAVAAIVGGHLEEVEPLLASAERALAAMGDEPHAPSVGRAWSVLANVPAALAFLRADLARWRGDPARAADCDQQALTHLGEEDWLLRSQVAWNLAGVDWLLGRLAQAEHALAELVAKRRAAGEGYL